jgi:hypothetical protein
LILVLGCFEMQAKGKANTKSDGQECPSYKGQDQHLGIISPENTNGADWKACAAVIYSLYPE